MTSHPGNVISEFDLVREPLLDQDECRVVVEELLALRRHWRPRAGALPFFTLGTAAYVDGTQSHSQYLNDAAVSNPLLRDHFGWLLERTRRAIAHRLGQETDWFPRGALPGFHIYLAHRLFALPVASIHYDLQYEALNLDCVADIDVTQLLSFTLPVSLPLAGGGLNTWDRAYDPTANDNSQSLLESVKGISPVRHSYRIGELVMHSGHMLHQAAPAPITHPDERRITLQGHGVRAGGRMYLYW